MIHELDSRSYQWAKLGRLGLPGSIAVFVHFIFISISEASSRLPRIQPLQRLSRDPASIHVTYAAWETNEYMNLKYYFRDHETIILGKL